MLSAVVHYSRVAAAEKIALRLGHAPCDGGATLNVSALTYPNSTSRHHLTTSSTRVRVAAHACDLYEVGTRAPAHGAQAAHGW